MVSWNLNTFRFGGDEGHPLAHHMTFGEPGSLKKPPASSFGRFRLFFLVAFCLAVVHINVSHEKKTSSYFPWEILVGLLGLLISWLIIL